MTLKLEKSSRFQHFDWEKVKTFYYVAKLGSFMRAAGFLKMSQPALSRQIAYLEERLGCPLFARHKGGVDLTRKGEELFGIVERVFIEFTGFARTTHLEMANGEKRKIRISTTHGIAAYVIGEHLVSYNQLHPTLLFEVTTEDQLIDIVMNDVDIAIRPYHKEAKGVCQEPLFTLEKKLYASPSYLENYGEPKTVGELVNHRFIAHSQPEKYPYSNLNWVLELGMPNGKVREPIFATNSLENAFIAAEKGLGIIGSYEEMSIVKNSTLKNILPDVKDKGITDYFIYPTYLKEDEEINSLKNYLCEKLNKQAT